MAIIHPQEQDQEEDDDDDIIAWFESVTENAAHTQTETLRSIIQLNHGTEYLRRWLRIDDDVVQDMDPSELESLFVSSVPLASHADLEPYIQRIADGEAAPILTQQPITMLSLSSGTTDGRPKYVPFTRFSSRSTLDIFRLAAAYRSRVFPVRSGGRILELIYSSRRFETRGGLTAGTATTHYFASEEFKIKQETTRSFSCSPYEVISCGGDYKQTTYCHLLLGLSLADQVEFVASTFAYSIVQALDSLEGLWEELCDDIRHGSLSSDRVTLPNMRRAVLEILSPDPSLASELEARCGRLRSSGWGSVIRVLWPNAKYVYSIMTGSMLPYLKKLRHYAGDLPLVGADYGSTESWIGVNMDPSDPPEMVAFTVIPTFSYFEFIPLTSKRVVDSCSCSCAAAAAAALVRGAGGTHDEDDFVEGEPVRMSNVKVGHQYEVVLTTFTGLYRYRLGDVVEVAGFYKGSPRLAFVCRRKLILTVNIDKNTEKDLQLVVEKGSRLLGQTNAELVDFTSHADVTSQPGHYVVYWEIKGKADDDVLAQCCSEMDASFVDHGYIVSRKAKSIGPLELRLVSEGAFRKIMEHCIANGTALSQFKTPRCTSNKDLLRILDRCTVTRFWSMAYG